jgi:hypothetical protein
MNHSRRNNKPCQNQIGLLRIAVTTVFTTAVVMVLVGFLMSRNRLHEMSRQQTDLERAISHLEREITLLQTSIRTSVGRDSALGRLAAAGTRLRPFDRSVIIELPAIPEIEPPAALAVAVADTAFDAGGRAARQ